MKKILAILAALVMNVVVCVGYGQSTVTQSTYPTVGAPCYVPGQKIIVQVGVNVLAIFQCQSGGIVQIGGSPNPNPSGGAGTVTASGSPSSGNPAVFSGPAAIRPATSADAWLGNAATANGFSVVATQSGTNVASLTLPNLTLTPGNNYQLVIHITSTSFTSGTPGFIGLQFCTTDPTCASAVTTGYNGVGSVAGLGTGTIAWGGVEYSPGLMRLSREGFRQHMRHRFFRDNILQCANVLCDVPGPRQHQLQQNSDSAGGLLRFQCVAN